MTEWDVLGLDASTLIRYQTWIAVAVTVVGLAFPWVVRRSITHTRAAHLFCAALVVLLARRGTAYQMAVEDVSPIVRVLNDGTIPLLFIILLVGAEIVGYVEETAHRAYRKIGWDELRRDIAAERARREARDRQPTNGGAHTN